MTQSRIPPPAGPLAYAPLTREEVRSVIDGRSTAPRVPVILDFWVHPETFGDREPAVRAIMARYPQDVQDIWIRMPDVHRAPETDPGYRWVPFDAPAQEHGTTALDAQVAITDWAQLDEVLARFPDPASPAMFPLHPEPDGRYRLGHFWFCLFERHWFLRGMTNALMDYYTNPDEVHRLFRALTDFYLVVIERAKHELGADGVFTSDDLGHQTGLFFSPAVFDEFFKPYYKELIDKAHALDMHFWLHACGCIEEALPRFVELGLDVIHPIQKHTMDERVIADTYGKDIAIWAGFDVQQTIPWGTPGDVRREVRFMLDTYARPEGRLLFTAGNGINQDCSLDSLEALYDEAYAYGSETVRKMRAGESVSR